MPGFTKTCVASPRASVAIRDLQPGEVVRRPDVDSQCWAISHARDSKVAHQCRLVRRGFGGTEPKLTCHPHRRLEDAAQALRAELEPELKVSAG